METWHTRLRKARMAKGLTAKEAARLVGVSGATWSDWESGKILVLSGENLVKVCKLLDLTEQYLMKGKEPAARPAATQEATDATWEVGNASNVAIRGEVPLISFTQAGNWAEVVDPF